MSRPERDAPRAPVGAGATLSVLAAAGEAPNAVAAVAGAHALTYAELAARVRSAAAVLAEGGAVERGAAVVAARRLDTVITLLALWELGAPVWLLHARLTEDERAALRARFPGLRRARAIDAAAVAALARTNGRAQARLPEIPDDRRPLAFLFTSGSAGAPKAVELSRAAFCASAAASAANLGWREDDRWLCALPLAHVGGLSILTRCVIARRCVVLDDEAGFSAERIAALVREQRITLVSLVPTMLARLLDAEPAWAPPPHLRAVLLGGAPPPAGLLRRAAARGVPALTTYGMTETCSQIATAAPGAAPSPDSGAGAPLSGAELRFGEDGRIFVRGEMVMTGYAAPDDDPPAVDAGGWFSTGDRGFLDPAGNLHVTGRIGDVIITGGENVDPREVERALERCPGVAAACVVGVSHAEWGEIVAAAVVRSSRDADAGTIADAAAQTLAPHKRPRHIEIVAQIPLGPTGKPDRRAARALLGERGAAAAEPDPAR